MNTNATNNVLVAALIALIATAALIAVTGTVRASDENPRITVTVDHSVVDDQLGRCAAGREIVIVADRTYRSGHGARVLTVRPLRPTQFPSFRFECDGELESVPSGSMTIEMINF